MLDANLGELPIPELLRTPCMRTSQNAQKAKFAEYLSTHLGEYWQNEGPKRGASANTKVLVSHLEEE
jgi:hypothetical protein